MACKKEWIAHGLRCRILDNPFGGVNGYVAVPKTHPAYGQDYDKLDINVHGGLTFASQGGIGDKKWPDKESNWPDPDVWWFGFDTAHLGDWVGHRPDEGHKWTLEEVSVETEKMARQFSEMKTRVFLDYSAKHAIREFYGEEFLDKLINGELKEASA